MRQHADEYDERAHEVRLRIVPFSAAIELSSSHDTSRQAAVISRRLSVSSASRCIGAPDISINRPPHDQSGAALDRYSDTDADAVLVINKPVANMLKMRRSSTY